MEAQDKITEQFKEAARKMEAAPRFPSMERVWHQIEDKLDETEQKRLIPFWKKGMAAAILLLAALSAFYLLRRNSDKDDRNQMVVTPPAKSSIAPAEQEQAPEPELAQEPKNNPVAENPQPVKELTVLPAEKNKKQQLMKTQPATKTSNGVPDNEAMAAHNSGLPTAADNAAVPVAADRIPTTRIIKGQVLDDQLEPLPGASVTVKGTTLSTVTDLDGNYEIKVGDNQQYLVIKGIGAKDQEVAIATDSAPLITKLEFYGSGIEEVSVYGQKIDKRSYTGALTTVTAKEISSRPVTDVTKAIEGAAPGVQVSNGGGQPDNGSNRFSQSYSSATMLSPEASSRLFNLSHEQYVTSNRNLAGVVAESKTSAPGQPGTTPDIALRGGSSVVTDKKALIVLDGKPYKGTLSSIDPETVEKISYLQDATATTLYGSRGVNGVIVVETKKEEQKKSALEKAVRKAKRFLRLGGKRLSMVMPNARPIDKIAVDYESYDSFVENPFENPSAQPLSTFSIDVDNASYANIRRFIHQRQMVPKDAVRVEEMINYFSYRYPQPAGEHPFSISTEYSEAPWNTEHKLLKIGLQGKIIANENLPASNLVFLIDVSGSMNEANKLPLLIASLKLLVTQLREQDKVAIVVYAGAAGLVLPSTSGAQKNDIIAALDRLEAGGSTAGGEGIKLAYKVAREHFIKGGNNRVILATDGDFNVGASSDSDMQTLIEEERKSHIFLTCLGYGMGNYKDSKMEILADKGNGNYAYIDNIEEANRFLVKAYGGTLYSIAKDVKIQIEFNPAYVQSYRLIGYENRKLRNEDFANDAVDAGDLGSGHTVTALYEIIPADAQSTYAAPPQPDLKYTKPGTAVTTDFKGELATLKLRYKKPDSDKSTEIIQVVGHQPQPLSHSSADFKLAASVAWFGLKLRASQLIPDTVTGHILRLAKQGIAEDKDGYKAEFVSLVEAVQ